jgi:soluble P-type ATPase
MLAAAQLGICVMSLEGIATETLLASDLITPTIHSALGLLENPLRIVASLRR